MDWRRTAFSHTRGALRWLQLSRDELNSLCRAQPWLLALWGALPFVATFASTALNDGAALATSALGLFLGLPISGLSVLLLRDLFDLAERRLRSLRLENKRSGLTADLDRYLAKLARLLALRQTPLSSDDEAQLQRLRQAYAKLKEIRERLAQDSLPGCSPLEQEADYAESLVEAYMLTGNDLSDLDARLASALAIRQPDKQQ